MTTIGALHSEPSSQRRAFVRVQGNYAAFLICARVTKQIILRGIMGQGLFLTIYSIINDLFTGGNQMGKGKGAKMTSKAASRIQSHADKTGKDQGFKSRAQRAASKKK